MVLMVMSMMKIRWSLTLAGRNGVLLDEYAGRADDDDDDNDDDDDDHRLDFEFCFSAEPGQYTVDGGKPYPTSMPSHRYIAT